MTYGDVKRQIFNLNWETEKGYAEEKSIISDSITRALKIIAIEARPIIKQYKISQYPVENIVRPSASRDVPLHYNGVDRIFYSGEQVKAYSFFCDGTGYLTITDDNGEQVIELLSNTSYKLYRGFASGNVRLQFYGELSYNIKGVALYSEIFSHAATDILPYASQVRYDFIELLSGADGTSEFMGFADKAVDSIKGVRPLNDFVVEGGSVLILDGTFTGEYLIGYKKTPQVFTVATADDVVVEISEDATELLPLLASYFIWLDDERSRAEGYYNQYEIRRDALLGKSRGTVATVVLNGGVVSWL